MDLNFCWNENQEREIESKKILKIAEEEKNGINTKSKKNNNIINNIDNNNLNKEKYPTLVLSKFEQNAFDKAKERQLNRMKNGTDQHAVGRVFKGPGFIAKPLKIIFTDFEIGKNYKKKFLLTNTSYAFNSFKLLDLPDNCIDFFVINYEKVGRVSAGVSVSIEVTFTPLVNEDIHSGMHVCTYVCALCLCCVLTFWFFNCSFNYFFLFFCYK